MKPTSMRIILVAGLAGALATAAGCGSSGGSNNDAGGGSGGSAGHGGSGGSGGSGGGTVQHLVNFLFNSDVQGFVLNTYCEPNPTSNFNIGGVCVTDGGV